MKHTQMPAMREPEHNWNLTPTQAIALQNELRDRVTCVDEFGALDRVAGVDVGFEQNNAVTRAAVAVLSFPELELVEQAIARVPTSFPYVPGLLSFRELPAVLQALQQLKVAPGMLLVDGHGYAHPRRFGIACHLGVLTDIPSIGVAKTRLVGTHDGVANKRGAWQSLTHKDEIIGAALRTKVNTKPIFISIGHRVSLQTAIDFTLTCTTKYRLPETTRRAHSLASGASAHA